MDQICGTMVPCFTGCCEGEAQSDDSADLVLIGVVVVLYGLIALVLVAIVLVLVRRRRA